MNENFDDIQQNIIFAINIAITTTLMGYAVSAIENAYWEPKFYKTVMLGFKRIYNCQTKSKHKLKYLPPITWDNKMIYICKHCGHMQIGKQKIALKTKYKAITIKKQNNLK